MEQELRERWPASDACSQDVRILVVDDELPLLEAVVETLCRHGYQARGVVAAEDALAALRTGTCDVLLTDLMMPGMGGMALVREALRIDSELVCIVMTGYGSVDAAVEAMKSGAADFILKPFKSSTLEPIIARAIAERRLRRDRDFLASSLAQRTLQLQAANRELEAFVHSVSHDLRAPLAAIAGFSDVLAEKAGELDGERAGHLLDRVRANARHMGAIIDDLLRLSRISQGELHCGSIDLSAMAAEIMADLVASAPQRRVELVIEAGLRARGDEGLVRIAFENLLGNAWKYTAKRDCARIELRAEAALTDSRSPVFLVRDNGAGFDMAFAHLLFQPFQRLHSAASFAGTGIGLSIVRRVVERHGGRVWAESVEGEGASFRLMLSEEDVA
jgi:signal transduction histidine kinase